LARFFELRLLGLLGFRPQLFRCVTCGDDPQADGNAFSAEAGGVVCPHCTPSHRDAQALPAAAFRVMRFLQTREWAVARCIQLTPETRGALERIMHSYIRYLLERELKSVEFLKTLRQTASSLDLEPGTVTPDVATAGG